MDTVTGFKTFKDFLFGEVPEDAKSEMFFIHNGRVYINVYYPKLFSKKLPNGFSWEIVGKASELTESDWEGIVEKGLTGLFRNYEMSEEWLVYDLPTPKKSGATLLKSLSLNPNNVLILKKKL